MSKTLTVRDPWRVVADNDTGWGNRLKCWDLAVRLRKILGEDYSIVALEKEYPELHFVDFPYTEFSGTLSNVNLITDEQALGWVQNGQVELDNTQNYETDFTFNTNSELLELLGKSSTKTAFNNIRLKSQILEQTIKDFAKDKVGLHIRRGNGVHVTNETLEQIPSEYRKYYHICPTCDKYYRFTSDEQIFKAIDNIISINPELNYYISIDVDVRAIDYYKNRYPGKIFTSEDFFLNFKKVVNESGILKPVVNLHTIGRNLIDFFLLANSRYLLKSKHSTWSTYAQKINNIPGSEITHKINTEKLL